MQDIRALKTVAHKRDLTNKEGADMLKMTRVIRAIGKIKIQATIVLSLAAALIMVSLPSIAQATTPAAPDVPALVVHQKLEGFTSGVDDTFTYRLSSASAGTPMPAGSTSEGYTFTIKGNASKEIAPIAYPRAGAIYSYTLSQVVDTKEGYTYDRHIYTIEVHIDAELFVANMVVYNLTREKVSAIEFKNAYQKPPTPQTPTTPKTADELSTGVYATALITSLAVFVLAGSYLIQTIRRREHQEHTTSTTSTTS